MNMAIAGGGTGGHLFPGIAIAEELLTRDPANKVLFIGTEGGLETRILSALRLQHKTIRVKGLKGTDLSEKAISLSLLPWAFIKSLYYVKNFKADIVFGVGGYVSGPVVLAGLALRIPTLIHEQNSFAGFSNRILGRYVDKVLISYEEGLAFFPHKKTVLTGVPLRHKFMVAPLPSRDKTFTLLILGGSQGSHEINQAMLAALPYLEQIKGRMRIIHQSGPKELALLKEYYRQYGFQAEVSAFIEDMVTSYGRAHLIISRAGAVTLAEITFCGRAALLIPYPYAANNHQEHNARALAAKQAALMILSRDLNGARLASVIKDLEQDRSKITRMEQESKKFAKPKAAAEIADICYQHTAKK